MPTTLKIEAKASIQTQRYWFEELGKELRIKSLDDWYKVTQRDIIKYGGGSLLMSQYNNCPSAALRAVYPEYPWKLWLFDNVPRGYWQNVENHKKFFDWLAGRLNIRKLEDWYKVTFKDIINNGGGSLLQHYNNSPSNAIQAVYPEFPWKLWLFDKVPQGYWKNVDNHRQFFDWLGQHLNIKDPQDWYKVTVTDIRKNGGSRLLLGHYNGSPTKAIQEVYPEYPWKVWMSSTVPNGYWKEIAHQKEFFDYLGEQLHISKPEEWYKVTSKDIINKGGLTLLYSMYNGCSAAAIQAVYPEYPWKMWLFESAAPKNFWRNIENQKQFFDWLSEQLHITHYDDWYKIRAEEISRRGGTGIINEYRSHFSALKAVYPHYKWRFEENKLFVKKGKAASYLHHVLKKILPPGTVIHVNYRHPELIYSETGLSMELDAFVPKHNLAFEYQGEQHYQYVNSTTFTSTPLLQLRDNEKKRQCEQKGISLIEVPYWWDHQSASLLQHIKQVRSDFLEE